jgi:hypothetical protein
MIERRKIAEERARKNHIGAATPERTLKRAQLGFLVILSLGLDRQVGRIE